MRFTRWVAIDDNRLPCPRGHWSRMPRAPAPQRTVRVCVYRSDFASWAAAPCGQLLLVVPDPPHARKLVAAVTHEDLVYLAQGTYSDHDLLTYLTRSTSDAA